jgi:hypothetical protein
VGVRPYLGSARTKSVEKRDCTLIKQRALLTEHECGDSISLVAGLVHVRSLTGRTPTKPVSFCVPVAARKYLSAAAAIAAISIPHHVVNLEGQHLVLIESAYFLFEITLKDFDQLFSCARMRCI